MEGGGEEGRVYETTNEMMNEMRQWIDNANEAIDRYC